MSNLFAWKFEFVFGLSLKHLNKLLSGRHQRLWPKTDSQDICHIIILLAVVAAAPINVWL